MNYITLRNGLKMPLVGFGVFQVSDLKECERSVLDAINSGYRLIDTAAAYMNEEEVGKAIKESGIKREEFFITTKLWVQDASYEGAKKAIETSLRKLGTDYIDLYLIHQPLGDIHGTYRAMEEAYKEGKLKAIGVSNFYPHVLVDFCESVEIPPMVNQVEIHPFFQQTEALKVMESYGVVPMAWGPLAEGKHGIFTHPLLTEIGNKYHKTAAQVALRWSLERNTVIIPKSTHLDRIKQNIDIFDFELTSEDMNRIATLDLGHSEIVDHTNVDFIKYIRTLKVHE